MYCNQNQQPIHLHMNKRNIIFAVALIVSQLAYSQTSENKYSLGLNFAKNEYNGDYGNGVFNFRQPTYGAFGLTLSRFLSPSFDIGLRMTTGNYGYRQNTENQFAGAKFDLSLLGYYKLNNGYFLAEKSRFSPFVSLGLGFASYSYNNDAYPWPTIILGKSDFIVPIGAGLKYRLNGNLSVQYQYSYNFTSSDVHDQNISGGVVNTYFGSESHPGMKPGNDAFGQHMIGIVFTFGKQRDSDHDGIVDKFDICPDTPLNARVDEDGCPVDSDHDGVPDYLDQCGNTPPRVKVDESGCPLDSDKDGIPDYMDK